MTIYTFHEQVAHYTEAPSMIDLWKRSWSSWGWEPRVLTLKDAMEHPLARLLRTKIAEFPTVNNREYEAYCFLRWCAAAMAAGSDGIWFGDYDVLNYGLRPFHPGKPITLRGTPGVIATCFGTQQSFDKLIRLFLTYDRKKLSHVSDQWILGTIPGLWGDELGYELVPGFPGWEKSLLVHYGGAYRILDKTRLEWMTNARPGYLAPEGR